MQSEYYLMYKNIKVLHINLQDDNVVVIDEKRVPPLSFGQQITLSEFKSWLLRRFVVIKKELIMRLYIETTSVVPNRNAFNILIRDYCQAIVDCYWIKNVTDTIDYECISIHLGKMRDTQNYLMSYKNVIHEAKYNKVFEISNKWLYKCEVHWEDSSLYLYKLATEYKFRSDIYCSHIIKRAGIRCVNYEPCKLHDVDYIKCKVLCNLHIHWVDVDSIKDDVNYAIDNFSDEFYAKIVIDFIIGNTDGFNRNWSISYNEDFVITGISEMYDFEDCLTLESHAEEPESQREQLYGVAIAHARDYMHLIDSIKSNLGEEDDINYRINKNIGYLLTDGFFDNTNS